MTEITEGISYEINNKGFLPDSIVYVEFYNLSQRERITYFDHLH